MKGHTIPLLLLIIIAMMSIQANMIWLALVSVGTLGSYLYAASQTKPGTAAPAGGGPKIRPIIVKRYSSVKSIYPSKMKIRVNPTWGATDWWEKALHGAAALTRLGVRSMRGR